MTVLSAIIIIIIFTGIYILHKEIKSFNKLIETILNNKIFQRFLF